MSFDEVSYIHLYKVIPLITLNDKYLSLSVINGITLMLITENQLINEIRSLTGLELEVIIIIITLDWGTEVQHVWALKYVR